MAAGVFKYGPGEIKKFNASGALNPGDVVVIGSRVGVVAGSKPVAAGDDYTLITAGIVELDALSTDTPAEGALMYWDAGNARLTTTASTHKSAGLAVAAKASGVSRMLIDLNTSVASATI